MNWHSKRTWITGIAGFTGRKLAARMQHAGAQVFGLDRDLVGESLPEVFQGDIRDQANLERLIYKTQPDVIFHLAGIIKSDYPLNYYDINIGGTVALFEAIRKSVTKPIVVLVSSSAVYGVGRGRSPVSEQHPLRPLSHYGISKLTQELTAQYYFREHLIPTIICRPFNLSGPGLPSSLALSAFARQIACAEKHGGGKLRVGHLGAHRDFVDVRDAVAAYMHVVEKGKPGEAYNVCSGQSTSIQNCLDLLVSASKVMIEVVTDSARKQRADVDYQVGTYSKIQEETGWQPEIPLRQSLQDLLNDWQNRDDACQ